MIVLDYHIAADGERIVLSDEDLHSLSPILSNELSDIRAGLCAQRRNTFNLHQSMLHNTGNNIFRNHHIAIFLDLCDVLFKLSHKETSKFIVLSAGRTYFRILYHKSRKIQLFSVIPK